MLPTKKGEYFISLFESLDVSSRDENHFERKKLKPLYPASKNTRSEQIRLNLQCFGNLKIRKKKKAEICQKAEDSHPCKIIYYKTHVYNKMKFIALYLVHSTVKPV